MNRILCLVLLSLGTVLIIYGFNALDSISSSFTRFFTGTPTDKTMWLLLGGFALTIAGLVGFVRPAKLF